MKDKFDKLTESAHLLLTSGYHGIYSDKREQLQHSLEEEEKTSGPAFSMPSNNNSFQSNANDGNRWEVIYFRKKLGFSRMMVFGFSRINRFLNNVLFYCD